MVFAELALLYVPNIPPRVGIIVVILALVGAVKFTRVVSGTGEGTAEGLD